MLLNYKEINQVVVAPKTTKLQSEQPPTLVPSPPAFDVYYAQNKFTNERVVVKVMKDFKSRPSDFQQCVMLQINNQIQLQQLSRSRDMVHKVSYKIVNNNLYVSSLACQDSLKQCIDRIQFAKNKSSHSTPVWPNIEPDCDDYIDTYDALRSLPVPEKLHTYIVLLIIHDCLKILKMLAFVRPHDAINFTTDNLLVKDGRILLSDAYLSKQRLKRELQVVAHKKIEMVSDMGGFMPDSYSKKLWQL